MGRGPHLEDTAHIGLKVAAVSGARTGLDLNRAKQVSTGVRAKSD